MQPTRQRRSPIVAVSLHQVGPIAGDPDVRRGQLHVLSVSQAPTGRIWPIVIEKGCEGLTVCLLDYRACRGSSFKAHRYALLNVLPAVSRVASAQACQALRVLPTPPRWLCSRRHGSADWWLGVQGMALGSELQPLPVEPPSSSHITQRGHFACGSRSNSPMTSSRPTTLVCCGRG